MGKKVSKKGKKNYEKYRSQNRKARNKELKAARHEKRVLKFKERKENGETYEYKAISFPKKSNEYYVESLIRAEKNTGKKLVLAKLTSCLKKLQNELDAKEKEMKDKKKSGNKKEAKTKTKPKKKK